MTHQIFNVESATMDDVWRKEIEVVNRLENGEINFAMAKEITNAMGKAIKVALAKLEYAKLRKEKPEFAIFGENK